MFLLARLHVPYHDVQGVVGIVNRVAKGHQVPLTGGEVYVLDPLVLKLLDWQSPRVPRPFCALWPGTSPKETSGGQLQSSATDTGK